MAENHPPPSSSPEIRVEEAEQYIERLNDLDGSRFDRSMKRIGRLTLGAEFGAREKSMRRDGERGGEERVRDGYAPEKRWSPSAVGRKRKYWDWFSRTRDRASTLGTQRELPTM